MKGMLKPNTITPSTRKAPAPLADITLTLTDYDLSFSKPRSPGKHVMAVRNMGKQPHECFMAKLMPGKSPMDMATFAENPVGPPPGELAFICFSPDMNDGKPHLAHGMIQQISVK